MVKKKREIHETTTTVIIEDEDTILVQGFEAKTPEEKALDNQIFTTLCANLEEIRTSEGVTGYILRNASTAIVDIKDQSNLTDYALLSSQAFDSSDDLCEFFALAFSFFFRCTLACYVSSDLVSDAVSGACC